MIKIYKDKDEKIVTKGAYENNYKHLGYNIVKEDKDNNYIGKSIIEDKDDEDTVKEDKDNKSKYTRK